MSWRAPPRLVEIRKRILRGVNKKPPEPIKAWNIKRGDKVQILAGRDKGKLGEVVALYRKQNKVFVQGMNTHLVFIKNFRGMMQREAPLHYSNVALVDPADNKPCRIKYMYMEDGKRVRVSRRSGRIIPYPVLNKNYSRIAFPDSIATTKPEHVTERTFIPSLTTFEEELAKKFDLEQSATDIPPQ